MPEDISLTGYDGIGALSSPALGLTTWSQPVEEIGRTAARRAIAMVETSLEPTHVRLAGRLVRGRTLGVPREHAL
ncbi:substrate-binding domain-containing protein [Candidatus Poriferisocius sp.]|uniref:substrate-binding domain-containing protein n=1 Tax=Candidatus Poriferisocius sp. TaxID=3101276 RepID=UPI003B0206BB